MLNFLTTAIAAISALGKEEKDNKRVFLQSIDSTNDTNSFNVIAKDDVLNHGTLEFASSLIDEMQQIETENRGEFYAENLIGTPFYNAFENIINAIGSSASALKKSAKEAINEERVAALKRERQKDEENIEKKNRGQEIYNQLLNIKDKTQNALLSILTPFLPSGFLFSSAFALEQMSKILPKGMTIDSLTNTYKNIESTVARVAGNFSRLSTGFTTTANIVSGTIRGLFPSTSLSIKNAIEYTSRISLSNASFAKHVPFLNAAQKFFEGLSRSTNTMIAKLSQWTQHLGVWFTAKLKTVAKKVIRWFFILEAIRAMTNALQLMILGAISKEEWHKRNIEQITKIIQIFGAPYLVMAIFALLGTVVPVLGNLAGGAAGLIVGILLGDEVFRILHIDFIIHGLYNWIFLGDTTKLKEIPSLFINSLTKQLPEMIASATKNAAINTVSSIADIVTRNVKIGTATQEEIVRKYGESITNEMLIEKASVGIGTDEKAIAYAFRDVKTINDYMQIKKRFEETILPKYNQNRILNRVETMEEFLQNELSPREYEQLQERIQNQIKKHSLALRNIVYENDIVFSSAERIDRLYSRLTPLARINDILGVGVFNVKGRPSDLYQVVSDMNETQFATLKYEYKKRYRRNLDETILRSFGKEVHANVLNIVKQNTVNTIKNQNESFTQISDIGVQRNTTMNQIVNQNIQGKINDRNVILVQLPAPSQRLSQYLSQPNAGRMPPSVIEDPSPAHITSDSFLSLDYHT